MNTFIKMVYDLNESDDISLIDCIFIVMKELKMDDIDDSVDIIRHNSKFFEDIKIDCIERNIIKDYDNVKTLMSLFE